MNPNEPKPWDQLPGESNDWYLRFKRYCQMGPGRSYFGIYNEERERRGFKKANRVAGGWRKKIDLYKWEERAAEYDAFTIEEEERAAENERREYRKREKGLADALIQKAESMLQFPLAEIIQETETAGGRTVIKNTTVPVRWSMRDAALMIETADKLMRLAQSMETERTQNDVVIGESLEEIRKRRWKSAQDALADLLAAGNGNGAGGIPADGNGAGGDADDPPDLSGDFDNLETYNGPRID